MNSDKDVVIAVFSGLLAGVIIGFLMAPEKGSVTRRRWSDKASDLADKVKSAASDTIETVKEAGSSVVSDYSKFSKEQ